MPSFVLLRHVASPSLGRQSHWDFMLERDGQLLTWSLVELPAAWSRVEANPTDLAIKTTGGATVPARPNTIAARRLADHRLKYLDFEGPLSGDRGTVSRVDAGQYLIVEQCDRGLTVLIRGDKIAGHVQLCAAGLAREPADPQVWALTATGGDTTVSG